MSTVPVGSHWQNKFHTSVSVTVIHMIDHEVHGKMARHIIFEEFSTYRTADRTKTISNGLKIMTKPRFEAEYERPDIPRGDEVP